VTKTAGRRRADCQLSDLPDDIAVGDYWKIVHPDGRPVTPEDYWKRSFPSNLCGTCWMIAVPNPESKTGEGYLLGNLVAHTVREHEDGTISVLPGNGSSNSILVRGGEERSWHGYVSRGVLEEC
jgi:hypothetical protein